MHVLITGASRGIGAALAEAYKARGDRVTATARDAEGLVPLDVTDGDSLAALGHRLEDDRLDLLVCNAGISQGKHDRLEDGYPPEIWAESFAVNVTGVFRTIQTCLPALRRAQGRIAIISSQLGSDTQASGGRYVYRASKAAALNLGRNLAADLTPEGIAVGIYHPGWVRTDMGGDEAPISVEESADGLLARFDALSVATTGVFETWDGRAHPY